MAVVFVELGQEVHLVGGSLNGAIHEGVAKDMWKDCCAAQWSATDPPGEYQQQYTGNYSCQNRGRRRLENYGRT